MSDDSMSDEKTQQEEALQRKIRQARSHLQVLLNKIDREPWSEGQRDSLIKDLQYVVYYLR